MFERDLSQRTISQFCFTFKKNCFDRVEFPMAFPLLAGLLKQNIVMLNFLPELSDEGADSDYKEMGEYVIVIDRSGNSEVKRLHNSCVLVMTSEHQTW